MDVSSIEFILHPNKVIVFDAPDFDYKEARALFCGPNEYTVALPEVYDTRGYHYAEDIVRRAKLQHIPRLPSFVFR